MQPRVRGDANTAMSSTSETQGAAPRARGRQLIDWIETAGRGCSPACAGDAHQEASERPS